MNGMHVEFCPHLMMFGDITNIPVIAEPDEEESEMMGDMGWEEIHNDSSLLSMAMDSQDETMFRDETCESQDASLNTSSFFLKLTSGKT